MYAVVVVGRVVHENPCVTLLSRAMARRAKDAGLCMTLLLFGIDPVLPFVDFVDALDVVDMLDVSEHDV